MEFNNFIKEKQAKVHESKARIKLDRKLQVQQVTSLKNLNYQRSILEQSLGLLRKSIESKKVFVTYLEKVVAKKPELFGNINQLLAKNSALIDMKNNLQTLLSNLKTETEKTQISLEQFKEEKMKETLVFNIKLGMSLYF